MADPEGPATGAGQAGADHAGAGQAGAGQAGAEWSRRATSFGGAAAAYAEHRPDYPATAIAWALEPVSGRRERPVRLLDLGAGTGKLTAALASLVLAGHPAEVIAVEPDPKMLAELHRQLPGVTTLAGRAEAIGLPDASVDAVLAGQSAHWFDLDRAIPEIARVLVPGGVMAGLWNADDDRVDWVAGLHLATGHSSSLAASAVLAGGDDDGLTGWLADQGRRWFRPPDNAGFEHVHRRTADSTIATMRTHSAFLVMEPAAREATLASVRRYLAATPQTVAGEFSLPIYTFALRAIRR
jgi:SAM-dependent methyltransferase